MDIAYQIDGAAHTFTIPDEVVSAVLTSKGFRDASAANLPYAIKIADDAYAAEAALPIDPNPPQYCPPALSAMTSDGAVYNLDATGAVFRNGVRVPGLAGKQIVTLGTDLFAFGKTDGKVWRYVPPAGWAEVTDFDATRIKVAGVAGA